MLNGWCLVEMRVGIGFGGAVEVIGPESLGQRLEVKHGEIWRVGRVNGGDGALLSGDGCSCSVESVMFTRLMTTGFGEACAVGECKVRLLALYEQA